MNLVTVRLSTLSLKFLCKFSRIFFRVCEFGDVDVAGYAEYSELDVLRFFIVRKEHDI
jgi:hypothetical protein